MYSNLIDQETFAAVVAAAPKVAEYKLELAREIVGLLDRVGSRQHEGVGAGDGAGG